MTEHLEDIGAATGLAVAAFDGDRVVEPAMRAADVAASAAGVVVSELTSLEDLEAVVRLYAAIWGRDSSPSVPLELLRALTKAGNYVAGAFDGEHLVGACVGFFTTPTERALHSHIAGVAAEALGRKIGFALKVHQRAWSLQRGLTAISWTFDPLISRNAHFNLVKLRARATEYLPNFYGTLADDINRSSDTDRLLVRWHLLDPEVAAACAATTTPASGRAHLRAGAVVALGASDADAPVPGRLDGRVSLVAVPADIEAIRRTRPELAVRWREAARSTMTTLAAANAHITGFDRAGWYIVEHDVKAGAFR